MTALTSQRVRCATAAVLQAGLYAALAPFLPTAALLAVPTRATIYTPLVVVWAMISQALSAHGSDRAASGRAGLWLGLEVAVGSGALCKARRRVPLDLLQALVCQVAAGIALVPDEVLAGRRVLVLDGTS